MLQLFCLPHWLSCLWQVIAKAKPKVLAVQVQVPAQVAELVAELVVLQAARPVAVLQLVARPRPVALLLLAQRRLQLQPR